MDYLILLVSFCGLILGNVLARVAWEEVDQYKEVLGALQGIIVFVVIALLMAEGAHPVWLFTIGFLYVYFVYVLRPAFAYSMLPFFLWMADDVAMIGSLVFFYGFPYASILSKQMGKKGKTNDGMVTILQENFAYLVVGVLIGIFL